jgi:lysophospholipase L1-like esterase
MLLFGLLVILPIVLVEWALRPFTIQHLTKKTTSIFIKDDDLGWKLKPDTEDNWGGVPVKINRKGLRGPEINYERNTSSVRILYLGDSVTFGYKLKSHEESFPYIIESILEETKNIDIETINAAVDGYSPWQEQIYLEKEGIKYSPDIVILSFVLNDVTEKFHLMQFGGSGIGWQLSHSYYSINDWFKNNSAVYFLIDRIRTRISLGSDPQKGAVTQEIVDVLDLAKSPNDIRVNQAWKDTLENLEKIILFCRNNNIPLVFICFPYTFQYDDMEKLSSPQIVFQEFALKQNVPSLDLLPLLNNYMQEHNMKPKDIFLDHAHLSPVGSKVVAGMIADFLNTQSEISNTFKK